MSFDCLMKSLWNGSNEKMWHVQLSRPPCPAEHKMLRCDTSAAPAETPRMSSDEAMQPTCSNWHSSDFKPDEC